MTSSQIMWIPTYYIDPYAGSFGVTLLKPGGSKSMIIPTHVF